LPAEVKNRMPLFAALMAAEQAVPVLSNQPWL
jgi:hypothetical protein